jgi:hypothetical protein
VAKDQIVLSLNGYFDHALIINSSSDRSSLRTGLSSF